MRGPLHARHRWAGMVVALLVFAAGAAAQECVPSYVLSNKRVPGKLNVHLVPHTHDDAGWLKTFDQYLFGANQTLQPAGVQYTLDSVLTALEADPARRFVYGEMGFFSRWWRQQTPAVHARVRALVAAGRLDFINGGWVQHDEASAHYEDMIDQTTRGHRFLNASLGAYPSVGWQIDPFGHSATHAALLTGALGLDALFFARSDYQDMEIRAADKALEHLWRGEPSYGSSADVFTGNFPSGDYGPPKGFSFDWLQADPPIVDDTCAFSGSNNVRDRVDAFVEAVEKLAAVGVGEDVMILMGMDFQYAAAHIAFKNTDKLMHHVNEDGRINVLYSTPDQYVKAKHAYGAAWQLRGDDFFPYANDANTYWTGYFTSRPGLKTNVRKSGAYLAAARQLASLDALASAGAMGGEGGGAGRLAVAAGCTPAPTWLAALDKLEDATAIGQHHDAITGTSKAHVAADYAARLAWGRAAVEGPAGLALARLALGAPTAHFEWCRELNASVCAPTARASAAGKAFAIVLFNSLAEPRVEGVRLPVDATAAPAWTVTGPGGEAVPAQLLPATVGGQKSAAAWVKAGGANTADGANATLAFVARVPALGAAAYIISPAVEGAANTAAASKLVGMWEGGVGLVAEGGGGGDAPLPRAQASLDGEPPSKADRPGGTGGGGGALTQASSSTIILQPTGGGGAAGSGADPVSAPSDTAFLKLSSDGNVLSLAARGTELADFKVGMSYYIGATRDDGVPIASGAYIFVPKEKKSFQEGADGMPRAVSAYTGPVVAEYRQTFSPWASAVVRLWAGSADPEVEWFAGPLPEAIGHEVVVDYGSPLVTGGALFTDSNGRRMMKRSRNARPTYALNASRLAVAGVTANYYPIVSAAALVEEGDGGHTLAVITDRGQGAASLADGALEVMVHRRLFQDDWKGVNEVLNDTECGCRECGCDPVVAAGVHSLVLSRTGDDAAAARRAAMARAGRPLVLGVVREGLDFAAPPRAAVSALAAVTLPPNVHLLTLMPDGAGSFIVRLAHTYEVGEHSTLSSPATVDLNRLLAGVTWDRAVELGLSAARRASAIKRLSWRVGQAVSGSAAIDPAAAPALPAEPLECEGGCGGRGLEVTLTPMQVRTFLLTPVVGKGGKA